MATYGEVGERAQLVMTEEYAGPRTVIRTRCHFEWTLPSLDSEVASWQASDHQPLSGSLNTVLSPERELARSDEAVTAAIS
jgi:hypothetical protein